MLMLIVVWLTVEGKHLHAQQARAGEVSVEAYKHRTYDGKEHPAELGKLWVRENRLNPNSRLVQLAIVRLKSRSATPGSPIVFLAGGPGIPGIGLGQVPVYHALFERLRAVSDVILLDQRGTGMSSPNLQCPPIDFSHDTFENSANLVNAYSQFVKTCIGHWGERGADLNGYNSSSSADDLEDLRVALGAQQLSLLAWSYGTELALATIRRHPTRINKVVLISTRGPDNLLKLPSVWDAQIKKVSEFVSTDAYWKSVVPNLESLIREVLARLEKNPIKLTINDRRTSREISLKVGKIGLQTIIRTDLSDPRAFGGLPALIFTINNNDYSILTRRIEQLYNGFGSSGMALATDCAAGWSSKRLAQATKEARTAIMSNVNLQWSPEICGLTGSAALGVDFRSKVVSDVPTLFVSGTLDPNSPPAQTEGIRRGFANAVHLIVENAGHESLPAPEIQTVIFDFFKGADVSERAIIFPRPRFITIEEAKAPPPSRR